MYDITVSIILNGKIIQLPLLIFRFHKAATAGQLQVIKLFIDNQVKINALDAQG